MTVEEFAGELDHGLFHRIYHAVIEFYVFLCSFFFTAECISQAKLHNKTVVITGANTGIGKETALELATRGAKVIIGCRDTEKGKNAAEDIRQQVQDANVIVRHLDLASFSSIRQFAAEVLKNEPRIHILINNAGVMACPKSKTEDGFETHFGVNHLGHFLLTNLLLDRMKASAPARIVNVSSELYFVGKINFDDINMDREYSRVLAYGNSKLAVLLFTRELAKRLQGTGVTAYCLHPGIIDTDLARHLSSVACGVIEFLRVKLRRIIFQSPRQGAQTTIHCAVDEKLSDESGLYYCACRPVKPLRKATDDVTAEKLWKLSESLTKAHIIIPTGPDLEDVT